MCYSIQTYSQSPGKPFSLIGLRMNEFVSLGKVQYSQTAVWQQDASP